MCMPDLPMALPGVSKYKGGNYKEINEFLRKVKSGDIRTAEVSGIEPYKREILLKNIMDIDSSMNTGADAVFPVLYRGGGWSDFETHVFNASDVVRSIINKKKIQTWWSYTSTSTSEIKARKFIKSVFFVIRTSPETAFLDYKKYAGLKNQRTEDEVLLGRKTKYRVLSIEKAQKQEYFIVHVEIIRSE